MNKKNLLILFTIILGLTILKADFCLALDNPGNPIPSAVGEGSAILRWEWDKNGGILKQFKILYKDTESTVWTARYPQFATGTITYNLMGLTENTSYQWRVKAEAQNPANDSSFVDGVPFTTILAPIPPPEENGNGWWSGPIALENPLKQDNIWDAMNALLNFLTLIAFIIAPVLIIYSALLMIFATGDAVKINKAKAIITWTLVALAIILFAKGLPLVIKEAMGG